jgi:hypothetical protein
MDHPLIFLVGLPRSGTTWIAKMFDSHPRTVYLHEADRGSALKTMPLTPDVSEAEALRPMAKAFADSLLHRKDAYVVGSQPQFEKDFRSGLATKLYEINTAVAKLCSAMKLDCPIFPMVNYDEIPDLHVVWKSVGSIGRLGVFVRVLEKRHAILLLRHPCGHVASLLRGEASHKFPYPPSEDYGMFEILLGTAPARRRRLTLDHIISMHPTERLAWRWVIFHEKALQDIEGMDGCMSIRYEDICAEPQLHARKMLEFCGLSWSSATASFLKNSTATENKKYYSVFKDPLRSAMRWQSDLTENDIDRIYRVMGESDLQCIYPRDEKIREQTKVNSETVTEV